MSGLSVWKKLVMKLAWWWNRQPGGSANSGSPAFRKSVEAMFVGPPSPASSALPNSSQAPLISGEVQVWVPATHLSYTSGPDWRRTMSSIQSVPGQPSEPGSDLTPMHHCLASPPTLDRADWAFVLRSSHEVGVPAV